ncbi:MAG TPA: DUF1415 domain-containing protein [Burkholderiaceae bacterium]|nr:DUF1415 domain-containing protein [Burkholderiaceae bacterium]
MTNDERAISLTRAWVERAVIGLNLCPFAKAPQRKGQVRYVLSAATDEDALCADLLDELRRLAAASAEEIETTLLIHPGVLGDFLDFNDFLGVAEAAVAELGLEGVLQVASFHPDYRFEDADEDDVANATNRSPFPTLHLLREESIDRAVEAFPDAEAIYEANIQTMEMLGADGWTRLRRQWEADVDGGSPDDHPGPGGPDDRPRG